MLSSGVSSQTFGTTAEAAEDFASTAQEIEIRPLTCRDTGDKRAGKWACRRRCHDSRETHHLVSRIVCYHLAMGDVSPQRHRVYTENHRDFEIRNYRTLVIERHFGKTFKSSLVQTHDAKGMLTTYGDRVCPDVILNP